MFILGAIMGELLFVIPVGLFGSNLPGMAENYISHTDVLKAFMVSQFPPLLRYTGVGIAYNVNYDIFLINKLNEGCKCIVCRDCSSHPIESRLIIHI